MIDLMRQIEDAIQLQSRRYAKLVRSIVPNATDEDLLQPNDFPELEFHPLVRYEEGVLEGLRAANAILRAEANDGFHDQSENR